MKIFDNKLNIETLNYIQRGFFEAIVDDARNTLRDDEHKKLEFGEGDYQELCEYDFTVRSISPEALLKSNFLIEEFFNNALNDGQRRNIANMDREQKIGFGIDLYQSLLYDNYIMSEEFRPAVTNFHPVDASPSIGMSVDGDVRIFFE